jgi:ABC-2 type transport system ATP-binding protein
MTEDVTIEVCGLTKSYGTDMVLRGIDFSVERGSVCALLGPNGAGKTTTVRILATLTRADAGTVRIAGFDVLGARSEVRARISLTGQHVTLDGLQTGVENLQMMGRLRGLSPPRARARASELLQMLDLLEAGDRRVDTYSGGMRRRLDLAAGLVTRPEVIFLDEPTTGLDPRGRQGVWDVVRELAASGVTILLTTQYLEEADQLADRIAVLDEGTLVAEGTAAELKQRVAPRRLDVQLVSDAAFTEVCDFLGERGLRTERSTRTVAVTLDGAARQVRALLDEIDPDGTRVADFTVRTASLDDVFLALTGHAAAGESSNV